MLSTVLMAMLSSIANAQPILVSNLTQEKALEMKKTEEGICQLETLSLFVASEFQPKHVPVVLSSTVKNNQKIVTTEVENKNNSTLKMSCVFVEEKSNNGKPVYRFSVLKKD